MSRKLNPEWVKWCIEIGELREQRTNLINHPHRLGEKWEQGMIRHYDKQINDLLPTEPVHYLERV